ncbi:MAG: RNA polymerase sigma-54 factor, partial [Catalinimonas sp.]
MQKLGLNQSLQQRLSPQQIQFIKLLQVPTAELMSRVEQELEVNPALEEGKEQSEERDEYDDQADDDFDGEPETIDLDDYLRDEDVAGYKMQGDGPDPNQEDKEIPMAGTSTLNEALLTQMSYLPLDERRRTIGKQLIGSIESDGYIRRDLESIVDDMAFAQNLETTAEEVEAMLHLIQQFDPAGIAARDLRECLILQIERRTDNYEVAGLALRVVEECFDEFAKRHYEKIQRKLDVDDRDLLRDALALIGRLNPKPGEVAPSGARTQYVIPDYLLKSDNGEFELTLNGRNAPDLR